MSDTTHQVGAVQIKDSGERQQFNTGAQRDIQEGKGRMDLLPMYAITRLAQLYEAGALKYGDSNWRLGMPLSRYLDSAMRHLMKFGMGMRDEPHEVQAMWNICGLIETKKLIDMGVLPKSLDDLNDFSTVDGAKATLARILENQEVFRAKQKSKTIEQAVAAAVSEKPDGTYNG